MKNYFILVLLVFTCKNTLFAQTLTGYVKDIDTRTALKNIRVRDLNSGMITETNEQGYFQFDSVIFPLELEFSGMNYLSKNVVFDKESKEFVILLLKQADQLSEIMVRSSIIPQELQKIPASVSLISATELQRKDNFNLVQNLNYVPGLYVNQGALNTNKIHIRGIGGRSQYSTNRIKAYINGIPLTSAEGELTLDDFDPDYLDRIEIFKGPVSSAFGAGLGGSINLFTNRNRTAQRTLNTAINYGSFNTSKTGFNFNFVKDSLDISLNYNQLQSDGYRQNGAYDRIGLLGTAGILNRSGNYWSFFYSFTNLKAYIPSSLNENDFENEPQKAAFTWNQAAGYESYDRNIFGVTYEHHFSEKLIHQTAVFFNSRDGYEPRPFNILDDNSSAIGTRTKFNYNTTLFDRSSELSFGAEAMFEFYEIGTFENLYQNSELRKSVLGDRLSLNDQSRNYINVFGQLNTQLSSRLLLELGLNLNATGYRLNDKFEADDIDQTGNYRFSPVISPRLGLSFEAFDGKYFYSTASHGFSTPTVAETLTPEGLINTDLKTETGWNYEMGFKGNWFHKKLYTEVSVYTIQIRDLLVARRVGPDQYVGINAGKADHNGIEFSSIYQTSLSPDLQLNMMLNSNFNFYKFDKFVDLGENYSGNTIPGVPEYMVSPGVEVKFKDITANLNYQAFGKMALDDDNSGYTDAYQLLNLKLNYNWEVSRKVALQLNFGANNIMDEKYSASIVPNAVGFGNSAPRYYYPGNPVNLFAGISARVKL